MKRTYFCLVNIYDISNFRMVVQGMCFFVIILTINIDIHWYQGKIILTSILNIE